MSALMKVACELAGTFLICFILIRMNSSFSTSVPGVNNSCGMLSSNCFISSRSRSQGRPSSRNSLNAPERRAHKTPGRSSPLAWQALLLCSKNEPVLPATCYSITIVLAPAYGTSHFTGFCVSRSPQSTGTPTCTAAAAGAGGCTGTGDLSGIRLVLLWIDK